MIIAFDFETHLIETVESPKPVCVSWDGFYSEPQPRGVAVGEMMRVFVNKLFDTALKNDSVKIIGQNLKFDLGVAFHHFPETKPKIFKLLDRGQLHDTMIREQLLELSRTGRLQGKEFNLAFMARKYLGKDLSALKQGADVWRLRYAELEYVPLDEWPKEAYDYALGDAVDTRAIYIKQEEFKRPTGWGSIGGEALQVKSDFCLQLITQRGIKADTRRLGELEKTVEEALEPAKKFLLDNGFAYWKKTKGVTSFSKRRKKLQTHIAEEYPELITLTDKGTAKMRKKYGDIDNVFGRFNQGSMLSTERNDFIGSVQCNGEVLENLPQDDVIANWREYMALEKIKTTFIPRLRNADIVFAPYRNLKETGRTSSYTRSNFPSLNIQQIPRTGGVRDIFIPRPGFVMATIDYSAIELACVAHTMKELFGKSKMFDLVNSGDTPIDLHAYVGNALYNADQKLPLEQLNFKEFSDLKRKNPKIYKKYRDRGKPIGLGYFGGLGEKTMCAVSRGLGIPMTLAQAEEGRRIHSEIFPEIFDYLGWRKKRDGMGHPRRFEKGWVRKQQVEESKWGYAYSANGRYRAGCTYCSCANGRSMQSLAADGLKEAIFLCVRACEDPEFLGGQYNDCFVLFEVHDEIAFELPCSRTPGAQPHSGSDPLAMAKIKMQKFEELMIEGMQKVIPTVRVTVEGGLQERWTKDDSKHLFTHKMWRNRKDGS